MNREERRAAARSGKTTDPLAITWYSNAIWAETGYGTQSKQAVSRLHRDGHHVAVASNYGLQATRLIYDGIPHYPMGVEETSSDVIEPTFRHWSKQKPDLTALCIALYDAWPLLRSPAWDRMPVGIWTMVDALPVPPNVLAFLEKPNVTPLAASKYAHRQILAADVDALYVPMAIDTKVYKPTATFHDGNRAVTGREMMGIDEDRFVVSCINANKSGTLLHRKAWGENLQAFARFAKRHDDAVLYVHTEKYGRYGGIAFDPIIESLGIKPHQIQIVNQWALQIGIPNEAMAALYSATDVLLAPTMGEGFGLTVLEAGACETPAIVSNFTCQPELVSEGSLMVGGQMFWNSGQAAWQQIPSVDQIVDALEQSYQKGRVRSPAQREHALTYDADLIYDTYWKPALATLAAKAREGQVAA